MSRLEKLLKILAVEPDDAFTLYGVAQEHATLGDHAGAIPFYNRCLAADPGYSYAYFHKARSQEAIGDKPGAIATLGAGLFASKKAGDAKAASEIGSYLDELT
ncbi:MAG: hypothetical protein H7Y88_11505 [Phycisphaerales bacterium]|nr:hypothetical protein [Phycisphaerales bacterium]